MKRLDRYIIVLAQPDIPLVRSQIINLPEGMQQESNLDIDKIRLDGKFLFRVATPSPLKDYNRLFSETVSDHKIN